VLVPLYYALVHLYGKTVLAGFTAVKQLSETQKRTIRIIAGSRWNALIIGMRSLTYTFIVVVQILKINEIRKIQVDCFMFKVHC